LVWPNFFDRYNDSYSNLRFKIIPIVVSSFGMHGNMDCVIFTLVGTFKFCIDHTLQLSKFGQMFVVELLIFLLIHASII